MKISNRGLDLIKRFEGYGRRLPDGSCTAYQEQINGKLDVPTIGYGCTRNVKMGTIWTAEQAEAALRAELDIHEARVGRLVTVEINQHQFDSLVSFDYNCGGLTTSDGKPEWVLKFLNAEKYELAAGAMLQWDKFGGKPSKGLTARRAAERALFLEPVGEVDVSYMPQASEKSAQPPSRGLVATVAASGAAVATQGVPAPVTQGLETASAWRAVGEQVADLGSFAVSRPFLSVPLILAAIVLGWLMPAWAKKQGE